MISNQTLQNTIEGLKGIIPDRFVCNGYRRKGTCKYIYRYRRL